MNTLTRWMAVGVTAAAAVLITSCDISRTTTVDTPRPQASIAPAQMLANVHVCSEGAAAVFDVTDKTNGVPVAGSPFSIAQGTCALVATNNTAAMLTIVVRVDEQALPALVVLDSIRKDSVFPSLSGFSSTKITGTDAFEVRLNGDVGFTATFYHTQLPPPSVCAVANVVPSLSNLTNWLFIFTDGSTDANWQGATKGYSGDVAVAGIANERTSGGVPYAGTIYTDAPALGAWQKIVDQNAGQAFVVANSPLVGTLTTGLANAFAQINALAPNAPASFTGTPQSLNGLNTQNGASETFVINITSGFQVSSKINITGDANDVFILRWDSDANYANGYQGQVKFQSGGAIVPLGALGPSNFVHVAGDLTASGGGSNPAAPYPQGPGIPNGSNWNGGGFFTGYWLTTGDANRRTASMSNAIFVGGWYSSTVKFSMTSGTSGVHVPCP